MSEYSSQPIKQSLNPLWILSGANIRLLRSLPPEDSRPYAQIGIYNIAIALMGGLLLTTIMIFSGIFEHPEFGIVLGITCYAYLCVQWLTVRGFLNKRLNHSSLMVYIIASIAIMLLFIFSVTYRSKSDNTLLPSATGSLSSQEEKSLLSKKEKAQSLLLDLTYRMDYLVAKQDIDTLDPFERTRHSEYNRLKIQIDSLHFLENYLDKKLSRTNSSVLYYKENTEVDNQFNKDKLSIFGLQGILYVSLLIGAFSAFIFLLYRTITNRKNDLYHSLVDEENNAKFLKLEEERQKILYGYKLRGDISNKTSALQTINLESAEEQKQVTETIKNLKSENMPVQLIAMATYEIYLNNYDKALTFLNKAIELEPDNREAWAKRIDIFQLTKNVEEEIQAKARYSELLKTGQFSDNLKHTIGLRSIEFNDISFYGTFNWSLRKNINILLGKNGYGKSHMMGIVLAILQEEEKIARDFTLIDNKDMQSPYIKIKLNSDYPEKSSEIKQLNEQYEAKLRELAEINSSKKNDESAATAIRDELSSLLSRIELAEGISTLTRLGIRSSYGKIPILAIPDTRFINKSAGFTASVSDEKATKILENGAYHFIYEIPFESAIQNFLNTICVIYTDEIKPNKKFNDPIFELINRVFKNLTGNQFLWQEIKRTQDNSGYIINVRTEGSITDIPIQKVSQGTLSVLAMTGLIFHYLSLKFPETERKKLQEMQAIVIIDEIDAHLHPSWQQKIIRILRTEFPNVQFIITAHSPLIVSGCREDEVSVLRKKENGFTVQTIPTNFIGKPIADIFKMVFEIEEKDEMYLELSALMPFRKSIEAEVMQLENKKTLNNEDAAKLQELRIQIEKFRYVDQFDTLLSGYDTIEKLKNENEDMKLKLKIFNAKENSTESIDENNSLKA